FTVITIKVNSCIGIEETQNSGFSLFPNPNSGILQFKSDQKNNYTLRIHNSIGQVIFMSEVSSDARIDMRSYKSGLYYIEVLNGTIPVYKQNIIKE
ncbi:MAG: T9SS type A sorting domain-containing protein, partial [Bacteroidia bacterium]